MAMVLLVFPLTFHQSRLYLTNRVRTHISEVFEVFKATVLALLILVAINFFLRERYSRLTLGIFAIYAFVLTSVVRVLFREALNEWRRRGHNLKNILVVGAGEIGQRVIETIDRHRELGFRVTGVLTRRPEKLGTSVLGVPVVGMFDEPAPCSMRVRWIR